MSNKTQEWLKKAKIGEITVEKILSLNVTTEDLVGVPVTTQRHITTMMINDRKKEETGSESSGPSQSSQKKAKKQLEMPEEVQEILDKDPEKREDMTLMQFVVGNAMKENTKRIADVEKKVDKGLSEVRKDMQKMNKQHEKKIAECMHRIKQVETGHQKLKKKFPNKHKQAQIDERACEAVIQNLTKFVTDVQKSSREKALELLHKIDNFNPDDVVRTGLVGKNATESQSLQTMRITVYFKDTTLRDHYVAEGKKLDGLGECIRKGRTTEQADRARAYQACLPDCNALNDQLPEEEKEKWVFRPFQKPGSKKYEPKKYPKDTQATGRPTSRGRGRGQRGRGQGRGNHQNH